QATADEDVWTMSSAVDPDSDWVVVEFSPVTPTDYLDFSTLDVFIDVVGNGGVYRESLDQAIGCAVDVYVD
ncbi:MAG TPA: hypothetical protein PLV68_05375, partial [Ilumatobacteraceae bacterium]|nr:hypothetical protein [Ilumatobacteraceae bacterium]